MGNRRVNTRLAGFTLLEAMIALRDRLLPYHLRQATQGQDADDRDDGHRD